MNEALARSFLQAVVFFPFLLCAPFSLFSSSSWSQSGSETSVAIRATPFVPPALSYASVFENYHGYQDQEVASWLEANETVGHIGGWRSYLEEASQSQQDQIEQGGPDGPTGQRTVSAGWRPMSPCKFSRKNNEEEGRAAHARLNQ